MDGNGRMYKRRCGHTVLEQHDTKLDFQTDHRLIEECVAVIIKGAIWHHNQQRQKIKACVCTLTLAVEQASNDSSSRQESLPCMGITARPAKVTLISSHNLCHETSQDEDADEFQPCKPFFSYTT